MVRKAGGKLSTKELGVVGDHKEARWVWLSYLPCWKMRMREG